MLQKFGSCLPAASHRIGEPGSSTNTSIPPSCFAAPSCLSYFAQAAKLVSEAFPPEMELKYEKTMCPFMLLHVNRYAGVCG